MLLKLLKLNEIICGEMSYLDCWRLDEEYLYLGLISGESFLCEFIFGEFQAISWELTNSQEID